MPKSTGLATSAAGAGVLLVGLWLIIAVATYHGWIHGADHRDFYPRWAGARLALLEGRDLYAEETTRQMQLMLYGRELPPDRDQQAFAYPAVLVPLLLPFWYIPDVEIATAAWEATSVILIAATLLLIRNLWGPVPGWLVVLLLLWYYPTLMIFQAQITALPLAAIGLGYWGYVQRRDSFAGAILVIGFVKPEQVAIPVMLMLLVALHERRWRVPGGFMLAGLVLFAASLILHGWWIPNWLTAVQQYAGYAPTVWGPITTWDWQPVLGIALVGFIGLMLVLAPRTIHAAAAAGIPLGLLLLPQTLIWGLTLLTVPLVLAYQQTARRWVLLIWVLGWLLLAGSGIDGWWRVQSLVLCVLTLALTVYASRRLA